jgi:sulfoxide reductase catalytic subunit YedY
MGILIKSQHGFDPPSREITDEHPYLRRREFIKTAAFATGALVGGTVIPGCDSLGTAQSNSNETAERKPIAGVAKSSFSTDEELTDFDDATSYNNFYEFGTDKSDPSRYSASLTTDPWSIAVGGEVGKPGTVPLETILALHAPEERIYRLRCVEAWSMVIPWIGIPLASVLKHFEPSSKAKYIALRTLHDPRQMPGQRSPVLEWPYREGLRLDEAMHPLTILATGMYGKELPNQNGAPLRLVVPWKYGFKSIKSIVAIDLLENQPPTSWNMSAPREYGFYSNVNPEVDHPRWSQKTERRIGEFRRRKTMPFNGYGEQVAALYSGMDLRKNY